MSSPNATPRNQLQKPCGLTREVRFLLFGSLVVLGIMLVAFLATSNSTSTDDTSTAPVDNSRLIRPDSPTTGSANAPVTLVEFLDPECESCRAAYPAVKEIMQTYAGRVRLVVRYFPLHTNSMLAALATEAAGEQGQYWEMQELLFTRQPEWGEQRSETPEVFTGYAEELGLDIAQFQAAMEDSTFREKIERDRQDGEALGVSGTPTFFVNGELVEPLSYERLLQMIDLALGE